MCGWLTILNPRKYLKENLSFEAKKRWTISLAFVSTFLGGTEFAIIFPTVWQYLQSMGIHDETYMGYVTSAFSVSAMFAGLLLGRLSDGIENIRLIALLVNLFQILGQMLYFIGNHGYVLIFGRFLSGAGVGMDCAVHADVIRGTEPSERSKVFTGIFMARQISIILAPAYHLVLRQIPNFSHHVEILGIPIDIRLTEMSAPGLVVCILWIIYEILLFIFYFNMAEETKQKQREDRFKRRLERGAAKQHGKSRILDDEKRPLISSGLSKMEPNDRNEHNSDQEDAQLVVQNGGPVTASGHFASKGTEYQPDARSDHGEHSTSANYPKEDSAEDADPHQYEAPSYKPARIGPNQNLLGDKASMSTLEDAWGIATDNPSIDHQSYLSLSVEQLGANMSLYLNRSCIMIRSVNLCSILGVFNGEALSFHQSAYGQEVATADLEIAIGRQSLLMLPLNSTEFFRPEIIALFFMQMTSWFVQTMVETIVPPLLQAYFGYGPVENSYFYMAAGIEFLLIYGILLVVLGKKEHRRFTISERAALLFSSFCLVVALGGFIVVGQFLQPGRPEMLYAFAAANILLFIAVPTTSVSSVALTALIMDSRAQGLGQGVRRFCTFVGIVFGPLWGGSMLFHPLGLYGGAMALALVALVLVLGSHRQFDVAQEGPSKGQKYNLVEA